MKKIWIEKLLKTDLNDLSTQLRAETFLRLAEESQMGVSIIRRGFLLYFNQRSLDIFGYTKDDIQEWKKSEYFKFIHPDELPHLLKTMKIEDARNCIIHFRGIRKNGETIPIENYVHRIKYQNMYAYFSTYNQLDPLIKGKYLPKAIKITKEKKLVLDYNPSVMKYLGDNKIPYDIVDQCSYREEK